MKKVNIYTDGACSGNPGPGGWAAILEFGPHRKEISGYMAGTTNNRMELFAAISGLGALKEPCEVTLYSDLEKPRVENKQRHSRGKPGPLVYPDGPDKKTSCYVCQSQGSLGSSGKQPL